MHWWYWGWGTKRFINLKCSLISRKTGDFTWRCRKTWQVIFRCRLLLKQERQRRGGTTTRVYYGHNKNPPTRFCPLVKPHRASHVRQEFLCTETRFCLGLVPYRHKIWKFRIWAYRSRTQGWLVWLVSYQFSFCSVLTLAASILIALKPSTHLGELDRMFYGALGRPTINK